MLRVEIAPKAGDDLSEIVDYLEDQQPGLGGRFFDAFLMAVNDLAEQPGMGPLYETDKHVLTGVRKWHAKEFPNHLIFYRVRSDVLEIVRVVHGARDLPAVLGDG